MQIDQPRLIVVEGPIGVGKTSLARRLADTFGSELVLEGATDNPFLKDFYKNTRQYALQVQLSFLLQRAQQMQALRQSDLFETVRVVDYLMDKDRLFAELTLNPQEFELYKQVYSHLAIDAPQPNLVIYLQAPVKTLMKRIKQRGIRYERNLDSGYLGDLCEAYTRFFHHYNESPLLIVNATDINLVDSDSDYQQLLTYVEDVKYGRHYFNPITEALRF